MFKKYRKVLSLTPDEVISAVGAESISTIYYLEKSYRENKIFKYLILLRSKGVDLNDFFDEIIKEEYPQYLDGIKKIVKKQNTTSQNDFEVRLSKLEDFQKAVTLKFQIEFEIEKEENQILAEENHRLKED